MKQAALRGDLCAPADLRYLSKPMAKTPSTSTSSVVSFLSSLYESVAETLPDIRDTATRLRN